jgi:hypothetical protein
MAPAFPLMLVSIAIATLYVYPRYLQVGSMIVALEIPV